MPKQKDRIIIDTNLWISFLLTRDFSKFDSIIADNKITLLFSEELVNEIIEVTQRIKSRFLWDRQLLNCKRSSATTGFACIGIFKCKSPRI